MLFASGLFHLEKNEVSERSWVSFLPRGPAWLKPGCDQYLLSACTSLNFGLQLRTAVLGPSPDLAPPGQRVELARSGVPISGAVRPKQGLSPRVFSTRASGGPASFTSVFLGLSQAWGPLDAVTTAMALLKISTCACDICASFLGFAPILESVSDPC